VKEALPLLSEEGRTSLEKYRSLIQKTKARSTGSPAKARLWWDAAVLMREDGHLFRGTSADFHGALWHGAEFTLRWQRLSGFLPEIPGEDKRPKQPVFLLPTAGEKQRLAATAEDHTVSRHVLCLAAAHALEGAKFLTEGTEEKARMLNTAGWWLQDINNAAADRIYYRIEKSFANTPTGAAILAKHWFVGYLEPW
jgi:hypothetical protein